MGQPVRTAEEARAALSRFLAKKGVNGPLKCFWSMMDSRDPNNWWLVEAAEPVRGTFHVSAHNSDDVVDVNGVLGQGF